LQAIFFSDMSKQIIYSEQAPAPIGPYSQAVKAGGFLFVSGQIAADLAPLGDIRAETQRVMESIGAILEAGGLGYEHIVKSTIFVKDLNHFGAINEVYGSFFPANLGVAHHPARETVEVARLPKDVNVEISVVAVIDLLND
jgi:2-iminobutanoate/2-iminopropanoate deaminase